MGEVDEVVGMGEDDEDIEMVYVGEEADIVGMGEDNEDVEMVYVGEEADVGADATVDWAECTIFFLVPLLMLTYVHIVSLARWVTVQ